MGVNVGGGGIVGEDVGVGVEVGVRGRAVNVAEAKVGTGVVLSGGEG